MPLKQSNPEGSENLNPLSQYEDFLSNRSNDHLNNRLLENWLKYGESSARHFCINDADKFTDKETILFLERVLFNAGENGLDKKTPWNTSRRYEAGLPLLHSFDE